MSHSPFPDNLVRSPRAEFAQTVRTGEYHVFIQGPVAVPEQGE
jgi:hypothetical protein